MVATARQQFFCAQTWISLVLHGIPMVDIGPSMSKGSVGSPHPNWYLARVPSDRSDRRHTNFFDLYELLTRHNYHFLGLRDDPQGRRKGTSTFSNTLFHAWSRARGGGIDSTPPLTATPDSQPRSTIMKCRGRPGRGGPCSLRNGCRADAWRVYLLMTWPLSRKALSLQVRPLRSLAGYTGPKYADRPQRLWRTVALPELM
jgi:hypothetical protein